MREKVREKGKEKMRRRKRKETEKETEKQKAERYQATLQAAPVTPQRLPQHAADSSDPGGASLRLLRAVAAASDAHVDV